METIKSTLYSTGMLNGNVFGGLQASIPVAQKLLPGGQIIDQDWCGHTCAIEAKGKKTGGKYVCFSSAALNPGIKPKTMAPASFIGELIAAEVESGYKYRDYYVRNVLPGQAKQFGIPEDVTLMLGQELTDPKKKFEVNLFGGDPDEHPEIDKIITQAQNLGTTVVNLTSTMRRLITDQKFVEALSTHQPNIMAVSLDDIPIEALRRMAEMSLEELKTEWKRALKEEPLHGQRQKAIEGIHAGVLMREQGWTSKLLFNMTIHPGNVSIFVDMHRELAELFPGCLANPYHVQGGHANEETVFPTSSLSDFEQLNNWLIEQTLAGNPNISKRLHYYLFMRAIFDTLREDPEAVAKWIFGYESWTCFRGEGASRYSQFGASPLAWPGTEPLVQIGKDTLRIQGNKQYPGGHRGCFWNKTTVTEPEQIGTNGDLMGYLTKGIFQLANSANENNKCQGCIMPRLIFDLLCLMSGMNQRLIPNFIALRRQYVGF